MLTSDFGKREHVESAKENLQPYNQTVDVVHASFVNAELMSLGWYLYS